MNQKRICAYVSYCPSDYNHIRGYLFIADQIKGVVKYVAENYPDAHFDPESDIYVDMDVPGLPVSYREGYCEMVSQRRYKQYTTILLPIEEKEILKGAMYGNAEVLYYSRTSNETGRGAK